MLRNARERARRLEPAVRTPEAEERLFERRLDGIAEARRRTGSQIERTLGRQHHGQLASSWNGSP